MRLSTVVSCLATLTLSLCNCYLYCNVIYGVAVIGETCGVFPGFLFM